MVIKNTNYLKYKLEKDYAWVEKIVIVQHSKFSIC